MSKVKRKGRREERKKILPIVIKPVISHKTILKKNKTVEPVKVVPALITKPKISLFKKVWSLFLVVFFLYHIHII